MNKIVKKRVSPDIVYNNIAISKFINYIMERGKKSVARKIVYDSFDIIKEKKKDPVEIFEAAIENVSPSIEVKSKRVGGATYQVPIPVGRERRFNLASRWIISSAKSKKGKPMRNKLAEELLSASSGDGAAVKKKEDVHRMAESNKAFAHFAR
ncbi:MAG: 30S ribosomal protein S7 [Candidatus Pacebacteria bacterium]|nr:30S ribosomal protein S7 [Candidatus Paceibacterota bacterium]